MVPLPPVAFWTVRMGWVVLSSGPSLGLSIVGAPGAEALDPDPDPDPELEGELGDESPPLQAAKANATDKDK
jgi:hypothetical protein